MPLPVPYVTLTGWSNVLAFNLVYPQGVAGLETSGQSMSAPPGNSNIGARRRVPKRSYYLYLPVPPFARPSTCFIGGGGSRTRRRRNRNRAAL